MDVADFLATNTFAQGDTEALVGKTSGDRRKIVGQWLDLEFWERVGAAAKTRHDKAVAAHETLLHVPEEPPGRARADVEAEQEAIVAEHDAHRTRLSEIDVQLHAWDVASEGDGLEAELEEAMADGRAAKDACAQLPKVAPGEVEKAAGEEESTGRALGAVEAELRAAQALVGRGFDGTCPVMGQGCPAADTVRCAGDAARARLQQAQVAFNDARQKYQQARVSHTRLRESVQRFQEAVSRYNQAAAVVRRLKAKVDARRARIAALGEIDPAALENERNRVLEALAQKEARFEVLKQELVDLEARARRKDERITALDAAARQVRVTALAKRALGPTGIPARISAESLGVLEKWGNTLLAGTGLSFTLALERETKDLSPTCMECGHGFRGQKDKACPVCKAPRGRKRAEELEVLVEDGSGEVEDVRAKSGGARALVASAIRLAGGMLLRERRGSTVAWAEVDEPFGSLDAENRDQLARCFTSMLGSVGLEQALIVSHDAGLLEALPARILITREDGFSRVSLEV